jgi:hypothetical protein
MASGERIKQPASADLAVDRSSETPFGGSRVSEKTGCRRSPSWREIAHGGIGMPRSFETLASSASGLTEQ